LEQASWIVAGLKESCDALAERFAVTARARFEALVDGEPTRTVVPDVHTELEIELIVVC
jgi:hypothetical protein